mmetsp:Transcript_21353/g.40007  ORF Transcript_21353/g.40007 Transcript_21353/m.40007 type:complete len:100 (+) Transcript_21353:117-416(+)
MTDKPNHRLAEFRCQRWKFFSLTAFRSCREVEESFHMHIGGGMRSGVNEILEVSTHLWISATEVAPQMIAHRLLHPHQPAMPCTEPQQCCNRHPKPRFF